MNSTQQTNNDDLSTRLEHTPIAIVGMASVFPKSKSLQQYWDNIIHEVDCITEVPTERWQWEDYYDPDPSVPDKTYCKRGGFIPDIDFNPLEFGLRPNILEVTDVSQLLSLVVAREALKDAGYYDMADTIRQHTGVILGVGGGQKLMAPLIARLQYPIWERVLRSSGLPETDIAAISEKIKQAYIPWEENSFPGLLGNVIAGRIANRFDLGGINCVVDAACAASLAALRMAVSELVAGRTNMMITGGVDTDNSIFMYMCFSKTPAFSKTQQARPFDAESDGMVVGEGVGMMILKRLADAERDGDKIYAVIKGIGASSDGRFKSIYAPRPDGQALALQRAYADAGVPLESVDLIEAHGTGTVAGDLCEFTTLSRVFGENNVPTQNVALGSVKSQIGHTKAAAGAASMIKTALALHHKVLPPTINVSSPNPKYDVENSPFYLNTESRPWVKHQAPRRAGVSSFGFGGTNYHVVLEEYQAEHDQPYRLHQTPQTMLLTATTSAELLTRCQTALASLEESAEAAFLALAEASKTVTISATQARLGFVAASPAEAISFLELAIQQFQRNPQAAEWSHPQGLVYRQQSLNYQGKVVALFSGQGSQYLNMGRAATLNFPQMRHVLTEMDGHFATEPTSISQVIYPRPVHDDACRQQQKQQLQDTEYAQPSIGVMSAGFYKILQQAGFKADFMAGHSFGELTALWAAQVLTDEDYFTLVKARGQAMSSRNAPAEADSGTMLAVKAAVDTLKIELTEFPQITIANLNAPNQVVLAGSKPQINNVQQYLQNKGYSTTLLPVSAAFHTNLVDHAQQPFAQAIQGTTFNPPTTTVYSNSSGQPYPTDPAAMKQRLANHLLEPVLFKDEIENIYAAGGTIFVEFGPRNVLTKLVQTILADKPHVAIAVNPTQRKNSDRQLREAAMQLRVAGLPLTDIDGFQLAPDSPAEAKTPSLAVKVAGHSYLTEKTRTQYDNLINDGWQLSLLDQAAPATNKAMNKATNKGTNGHHQPSGNGQGVAIPQPVLAEATLAQPVTAARQVNPMTVPTGGQPTGAALSRSVTTTATASAIGATPQAPSLSRSLAQFHAHQNQTAETHQTYLKQQADYAQAFSQISARLNQLTMTAPRSTEAQTALETLGQTVKQFQAYQAETVSSHEQYLQSQGQYAEAFLKLVQQQSGQRPSGPSNQPLSQPGPQSPSPSAPPVAPAAPVQPASPVSQAAQPMAAAAPSAMPELAPIIMAVVSEKTGYPAEMLSLEMDMEADLGIDSINRVEILAGVQERFPELPPINPEDLAELRTLQEIVDFIKPGQAAAAPAAPTQPASPVSQAVQPTVAAAPPSMPELAPIIMEVVSEKTGYPSEMLSLEMDMEADLGIDSINRVEILAGVQERFPELPPINPEDLAELRTLQEIVDFIEPGQAAAAPAAPTQPASPVSQAVQPTVAAAPSAMPELAPIIMEVVSEKTGYPAEMLSLEMDMEADLGIDSINRVEILAGVQERFPELPPINPEDLAELRTLQEIVDFIEPGQAATATAAPVQPASPVSQAAQPTVAAAPSAMPELAPIIMEVVSEKTGYPAEMLSLEMDMEADLGIDSINRVEILAGVQERFPELPPINPEDLAELRTLQEIVDFIEPGQAAAATAAPVQPASPVSQAVQPTAAAAPPSMPELAPIIMEVVSEKTGYPAEMLSLEMDMEADLGIDSINRVEILAGVQERFPELPPINPEDLAELRTLQEIVDFIKPGQAATAPAAPVQPASPVSQPAQPTAAAAPPSMPELAPIIMEVVSEKTGYPSEMLSLEMDMEADLGIDSINRVEILAGVQERFPELPPINPEDLAELRTLQEIVDFIEPGQATAAPAQPSHGVRSTVASPQPDLPDHNIKRLPVGLKHVPQPDKMAFQLAAGQVCLLTDDGSEATIKLAETLQGQGWSVVVLSFPSYIVPAQAAWPTTLNRVLLDDLSESHLQQQLSGIASQYGPIGSLIHVGPTRQAAQQQGLYFAETEKALAKTLFLLAKHLKASLVGTQPSAFLTVARLDGALGLKQNGTYSVMDGSWSGLVKSLNQEWPSVYCRAIDLSPNLTADETVQQILAELHDPNRQLIEVGYSRDGRVTVEAVPQ